MPETVDLFVPLAELDEPLAPRLERALGWPQGQAGEVRVLRRALDARKRRPLGQRLRVLVARRGETLASAAVPAATPPRWPQGRPAPKVVVVGSGPAGSWAALRLAEAGVPVTIVEQGKPVQPRRRDLALLTRGELSASSNYCFGEGGAGTYSDGKLYTRAKDREGVGEVLADLVRFGAPDDIAVDARPHVGSNRLPRVLQALRAHLSESGVDYRFETTVAGLRAAGGRVRAVRLAG
ncbi:MAG TPA: FAD-dependent oxidoreductase, partial [Polyangia bacterium]|nr:FAD-dependent oxidoreductase [Polyangia bacterium]